MPSSKEYLNYILEQLAPLEEIAYRPMMGEYILYYQGKVDRPAAGRKYKRAEQGGDERVEGRIGRAGLYQYRDAAKQRQRGI